MLFFNGRLIPGTHDAILENPTELQVVRTYFWGLRGVGEVVGGHGGRELSVFMWLHNRYGSRQSLEQAVDELGKWIGENGVLVEQDYQTQYTKVYENVTFTAVEHMPVGGRESVGPIFDYARTVDGGWLEALTLRFYQLQVPANANANG
ncbi:MAG: hypothetical protein ACYC4U_10275 [Pirellulaceae bacterium]